MNDAAEPDDCTAGARQAMHQINFDLNHKYYNFLKFDWSINHPINH